jgi:tRNA (cytidine/uridine-2'-O-)-methyltransferase
MNIVLLEPEIPYNTGNIGRTCVLTGTSLHLVKPLGFSLDEKQIKRAGLDYWKDVDLHIHENLDELIAKYSESKFYFATTKTNQKYSDVEFKHEDFIVFGPESRGVPKDVLDKYKETNITIPMRPIGRSLNLSNSAAIILYEACRQLGFDF